MEIVRTVAAVVQQVLGPKAESVCATTRVIQRRRKFTAATLLRTIVMTSLKKPLAHPRDYVKIAARLGVVVSEAAIVKRFSPRLVSFLRATLEKATQKVIAVNTAKISGLLANFTSVRIGDATTIALPDEFADEFSGCGGTERAGLAALKVQVLWDFLTGSLLRMLIEPGSSSDARSPIAHEATPAGSLSLFDLGYFCFERFRRIMNSGAYWISRLQMGVKVFDTEGQELSLVELLRQSAAARRTLIDMPVLLGKECRLSCRLIALRIPQEMVARRRQKANEKAKKHGRTPSADYLEMQGWTIYVTNCQPEQLTWQAVVVLYRTRWQIELLFKLWKSHSGLAMYRPKASAHERLALIYAKLIAVLVQHWILLSTTYHIFNRSLRKAADTIREWVADLINVLDDQEGLVDYLERLRPLLDQCRVNNRTKNPSVYQLLDNPELLEYLL
jgi:hypothetical protein